MAQSRIFYQIAPKFMSIFWRNLVFFVTLRQNSDEMETNVIGREEEKRLLNSYIGSPRSEFIAIYGRRRIGKTFLVKEMFEGRFAFRMTG